MADALLSNAKWVANTSPYAGGGTYLTGMPFRFVAHTTEVIPSSAAGVEAMARRHEYPPHLWADPSRRLLLQTVPLNRAAAALKRATPPAGMATNKGRAIQVEIIGKAAQTPSWPAAWWKWLGEAVLAEVVLAGYPIDLNNIAPLTGNDGYGENGKVRFSWSRWHSFDGVCAHSNVPENSHWDIGAGRLDLMAAAARAKLAPAPKPPVPKPPTPTPTPPVQEDLVQQPFRFFKLVGNNEVWLVPADHSCRISVPDQTALLGHRQLLFAEAAEVQAKHWDSNVMEYGATDPVGVMLMSLPVRA